MNWILISILISQQIYPQQESEKKEYQQVPKYDINLKVNSDPLPILNGNFRPLDNKGDVTMYSSFNNYQFLFEINSLEIYKYNSITLDDKVISVTLYQNMSSLGESRVYQNMSSIGESRVYQNMSSIGESRVYQNMSKSRRE